MVKTDVVIKIKFANVQLTYIRTLTLSLTILTFLILTYLPKSQYLPLITLNILLLVLLLKLRLQSLIARMQNLHHLILFLLRILMQQWLILLLILSDRILYEIVLLLSDLNLPGLEFCYFLVVSLHCLFCCAIFDLCNYLKRRGSVMYCGYFMFPVCGLYASI